MSQRCPVCKTRLWTDPLLTQGRLKCPRCGVDFRPTVPWGYFRILLLAVVVVSLVVIIFLSETHLWIVLFLIAVTVFFWFLPRLIDLERIPGELTTAEGPMDTSQLKLKLEDQDREQAEAWQEELNFRQLIYFLIALILFLLLVVGLTRGF
jgi:uncharacterized protein (DUF983 family)